MKYPPHLTFAGETYPLSEQQWLNLGEILASVVRHLDDGPVFPRKKLTHAVIGFLVEEGLLPQAIH
jgi:hypothetical protein